MTRTYIRILRGLPPMQVCFALILGRGRVFGRYCCMLRVLLLERLFAFAPPTRASSLIEDLENEVKKIIGYETVLHEMGSCGSMDFPLR